MGFRMEDAIFYHIYALGAFGAPAVSGPGTDAARLAEAIAWLDEMERVGANVLLIGPLFASMSHGYDTVDLFSVDARLGTKSNLAALASAAKARGISLVLDAVFNHVGRAHPIVADVAARGAASPYASWIAGFDPSTAGRGGLGFGYEGWKGHYELVKLDGSKAEVREYLIGAALSWIRDYGVDGLRLDAADCLDRGFLSLLAERCREADPDFVLIGEAVHGDQYAPLLDAGLDSVTDYEAWKGLWSSLNDGNFHEIAWTLDRLFSAGGLCAGAALYNFADNHDVDRVASLLENVADLYPLYALLYAMPGVPSLYYGSERGLQGRKAGGDDSPLRPRLTPGVPAVEFPQPDLRVALARFAAARRSSTALRRGGYRKLAVGPRSLDFLRMVAPSGDGGTGGPGSWGVDGMSDYAAVAINGSGEWQRHSLELGVPGAFLIDLLDPSFSIRAGQDGACPIEVPPRWARYLVPARR